MKEILTEINWKQIEHFFIKLFLNEGYNQECAEVLGFHVAITLQDSTQLLKVVEEVSVSDKSDMEKVLLLVHILFQKSENLVSGQKILMSHKINS